MSKGVGGHCLCVGEYQHSNSVTINLNLLFWPSAGFVFKQSMWKADVQPAAELCSHSRSVPVEYGWESSQTLESLLPQSLIAKFQMSLLFHPTLMMQGDSAELPEELVPCGLCVIHPGGLHLPDGGQSGLRGLQNSQGTAHRPLHQNPEPASTASPVQTHPLHPPVGGGEKQRLRNRVEEIFVWKRPFKNSFNIAYCM